MRYNPDINRRYVDPLYSLDLHYMLALLAIVCESPKTLSVLQVNRLADAIPSSKVLIENSDLAAIKNIKTAISLGIYNQPCVDRMLKNINQN